MKLLRLKITDPAGFRSLPSGFEHHFRTEWGLQDELAQPDGFAPFVCVGPNGSGKSNLLEALAAIFFQLEVQRVRRNFLPQVFQYDPDDNPNGIQEYEGSPNAYELEYLIKLPSEYRSTDSPKVAHMLVTMQFGPAELAEEIETWKDVYVIEERYKAKLCAENDSKYWLTQVLDEWREDGRAPDDFMNVLSRQVRKIPYPECNFLKKPFLDGCQRIGLFENSCNQLFISSGGQVST